MPHISTGRRFLTFSAAALLLVAVPTLAQKSGPPPPSTGGGANPGAPSPGGIGTPARGTYGNIPNASNGSTNNIGANTRPVFLSGKVMFDDGTQPNPDIRIERVCGGSPRLEAHTDSKGRFSFQLGQNSIVDTDAEDDTTNGTGRPNGQFNASSTGINTQSNNRMDPLWNCELRASYPGYRSDVLNLADRRSLDDPEVGTIVLHRLANVQGSTISLTTALAPRHAQKDYEKGVQLEQKGKLDEAEKHFELATAAYPKYAIAWFALGEIDRRQSKPAEARKAYESAIAADHKYVSPYDQLALLSAREGKWQDAADFSKQAIQLNPVEFPGAFWCNAIANYNLKRADEAETSAKELLKLDSAHRYPEAESMLAQILLDKRNYPDAATHLRAYLALVPNAKNADELKQVLAKLDQAGAVAKK